MRKKAVKYIVHFLLCELLFLPFFGILLVYHGPFGALRDYIVSTTMETYDYKFLSTLFLSSNEINGILARTNPVVKDAAEDTGNVIVTPVTNKGGAAGGATAPGTSAPGASAPGASAQGASAPGASAPRVSGEPGVTVQDISGPGFRGKLMVVDDPARITVGVSPELGKMGATLSSMVKYYKADGGINAGGFMDVVGAVPGGIVIEDGRIRSAQKGMSEYGIIGFNYDNILVISNKMPLSEIKSSHLRCAISFGPALIINGQPLVTNGGTSLQPRSAIAQRRDGSVLLLVIDGRQSSSRGVDLKVLQDVLLQNGAYNAANLDGGGSTTLDLKGRVLNSPSDITGERLIASAFLLMPPEGAKSAGT